MERKATFEKIMSLITNATRYMRRYESLPRSYGTNEMLYSEECHTIEMIAENERISITEMAKRMRKTKSATSQLVDRLVKKGMLEKHPHPDNDRGLLLKLTPKGEMVFAYHAEYDKQQYGNLFESLSGFSDRELATYIEIQRIINKWLSDTAIHNK